VITEVDQATVKNIAQPRLLIILFTFIYWPNWQKDPDISLNYLTVNGN
jgi:hypothetical protein